MRKVLAVTVGVLITMMALAACGGGGGSSKNSSGDGKGSAAFQSLYNKRNDAKLKVTYQATDDNGSKGDEITIAKDGPDKSAYIQNDSEIIVNGQTVTSCQDLNSTPTCSEVPGGPDGSAKAMIAGFTGLFGGADTAIGAALSSNNVGDKSSETIAGRSATCWKWSAANIGGIGGAIAKKLTGDLSYEVCLDNDTGIQLKWQAGAAGHSASFEATKVEQPTDADFEPPASAATTTTSDGSTTQTTDSGSTTETTDSGNTTETTTACTQITLPNGVTIPGGITLPCLGNG